jgi:hypothetical protein
MLPISVAQEELSLSAFRSAGAGKELPFCAACVIVMKRGPENELFYTGFEVDLRKAP